jgi:hypothetical protein
MRLFFSVFVMTFLIPLISYFSFLLEIYLSCRNGGCGIIFFPVFSIFVPVVLVSVFVKWIFPREYASFTWSKMFFVFLILIFSLVFFGLLALLFVKFLINSVFFYLLSFLFSTLLASFVISKIIYSKQY